MRMNITGSQDHIARSLSSHQKLYTVFVFTTLKGYKLKRVWACSYYLQQQQQKNTPTHSPSLSFYKQLEGVLNNECVLCDEENRFLLTEITHLFQHVIPLKKQQQQ